MCPWLHDAERVITAADDLRCRVFRLGVSYNNRCQSYLRCGALCIICSTGFHVVYIKLQQRGNWRDMHCWLRGRIYWCINQTDLHEQPILHKQLAHMLSGYLQPPQQRSRWRGRYLRLQRCIQWRLVLGILHCWLFGQCHAAVLRSLQRSACSHGCLAFLRTPDLLLRSTNRSLVRVFKLHRFDLEPDLYDLLCSRIHWFIRSVHLLLHADLYGNTAKLPADYNNAATCADHSASFCDGN